MTPHLVHWRITQDATNDEAYAITVNLPWLPRMEATNVRYASSYATPS